MAENVSPLPSVDSLLRAPETELLLTRFGRTAVTATLREILAVRRAARTFGGAAEALIRPNRKTAAQYTMGGDRWVRLREIFRLATSPMVCS